MTNKRTIFHPIRLIGTLVFLMAFTLNIQTSLNGEWELVNAGFALNGSGGDGGSGGSGGDGWLWESHRIECTATITVVVGGVTYTETYSGTKRSCTDGSSLCLSTLCG